MIYHLTNTGDAKQEVWCSVTRKEIAQELGLTKRGIINMVERMIEQSFLFRNEKTGYLKATAKWKKVYSYFTGNQDTYDALGEQTSPSVNKLHPNVHKALITENNHNGLTTDFQELDLPFGEESSPIGAESSPPIKSIIYTKSINTDNTKKRKEIKEKKPKQPEDIECKKETFFKRITEFKNSYPEKYPASLYEKFFSYWTESDFKKGSLMRFESEKFFEIPKRLSTFWNRPWMESERQKFYEHLKFQKNGIDKTTNKQEQQKLF